MNIDEERFEKIRQTVLKMLDQMDNYLSMMEKLSLASAKHNLELLSAIDKLNQRVCKLEQKNIELLSEHNSHE